MNPEDRKPSNETYKINCTLYPEIFNLDKSLCKSYFRQFGKILRIIFKPKQRSIVIEYTNKEDYFNALSGPSEYEGHSFKVEPFEPPTPPPPKSDSEHSSKKKLREKYVKKHKLVYLKPDELAKRNVSYIEKSDIDQELVAMGGYTKPTDIIDLTSASPPPETHQIRQPLKLNRVWKKSQAVSPAPVAGKLKKIVGVKKKVTPAVKKLCKETTKMLTAEQLELLKVIKSQANSVEERYRLLDARDKLLRSNIKKSKLKSSPTIGTCPDMCPEKERLMREVQHQVALYEQDAAGKHSMDPSKAVKQYSRSSADQEAPLPHELRPVSVLQMTMVYLMCSIMDLAESDTEVNLGEWFHFLWDRTRGIRKDITQQALCCHKSVELVEQCARFHIHCSARLMGEDPSVFDQKINTENLTKCLQTLKYLYHDLELKGEHCPHEAEFRAYIILLNLSDGNFMWEVQQLRREVQKSSEVKFALQVYSAFEKRNYVKFFKLIKTTTYLNACILMRYFVQVRLQALESLVKCFTPPKSISFYPIQELTHSLLFDDHQATVDFMKNYGIGVNKDYRSFMIERSSFTIPEFPYVMDRSKCVEEKRVGSVGVVVNGGAISPELYMEVYNHQVQNSFDENGFLVHDDMFNELELSIEEQLLDEGDSRESTPERKSMVTNIFAAKQAQQNITSRQSTSPNVFAQSKENTPNIFAPVTKPDPTNIFAQSSKAETVPNIFGQPQKPHQSTKDLSQKSSNIFASSAKDDLGIFDFKDEVDATKAKENIFALQAKQNIFAQTPNSSAEEPKITPNVFSRLGPTSELRAFELPVSQPDRIAPTAPNRDPRLQPRDHGSQPNIFAPIIPSKPSEIPKKGGFTFALNVSSKDADVPNIFPSDYKRLGLIQPQSQEQAAEIERRKQAEEAQKIRLEEEKKKRIEEELRRKNEELRRRNEEAAERRRLEAERIKREEEERKIKEEQERIERERRLEQERVEREKRMEEERKRQEEEMKRRLAEMERRRKEAEEQKKRLEIEQTVRSVVTKMVDAVDLKLRQETLQRINDNIKRRYLIRLCRKWHRITVTRTKKRKALDCKPLFVNTKSVGECARELHSKSQELALSNMKRYKYGHPLDIPVIDSPFIGRLKLFNLTYSTLRRRLCELKEKWHQHLYWKVVISIPDVDEVITGLSKLEEILKSHINWQLTKYGSSVYIEQHKTITYCVEKQQGLEVKNSDSAAYIFIAKDFNELLQKRIFENLKGYGVYVKVPLVLILEDTSNSDEYLDNLKESGVVSDYVIYSCSINSSILTSVIENGLIFLAKGVEKYPPLELDTMHGFLTKHLCTEIWQKAGSYAKWNHEYNFCMKDPNIVITLYNEAIDLLTKIALAETRTEHPTFPEIFRDYLQEKLPEYLPCDYRYFPNFWNSTVYENHLKSTLENLKLPQFLDKWPPNNVTELLMSATAYCRDVFKNVEAPLSALVNILQESALSDDFSGVTWIEAIQVLAREKLKEQDWNLPKGILSDVFTTLIVVYDVNMLSDYCSSEWFYRNNPTIEGFKKIIANKIDNLPDPPSTRKRILDATVDAEDDILSVVDRAERMLRSPKNICLNNKNQIKALNRSIQDLEDSIRVVKKMDDMNLFKRFIED